ncbi:c-type cytochrome [Alloyangia pacifica]|uniref:c-type cytochrome n=1 Tax=Alloyangia pacifica TaxID=311180 RepID=UPI001CD45591|nr:c-type cytochrome [Alloyangia pacifica]MCA0996555.1 c-type cytochrome [Alloyangia pacifica]
MSKSLKLYGSVFGGIAVTLTFAVNMADRFVADMPESPRHTIPLAKAPEPAPSGALVAAAHADEAPKEAKLGIGRPALPEEVAAWNLDVSPDGTGLPPGSGSVEDGEMLFSDNCASCHGEFAEGSGNWPKLAGGEDTLANKDPVKTVGSYWPYLSTVWDYVHRSMPFGNAQSLAPDEVYAITAYILYSNYLVEDDFVLSDENFSEVVLPNTDGFIIDDRAETEYPQWRTEPCMSDCKESVEITMQATVLDVTPDKGADEEASATGDAPKEEAAEEVQMAAADTSPKEESPAAEPAPAAAAPDPELVAAGEKIFRKCQACHAVGEDAKNKSGPVLNGVVGATVGHVEDFRYSKTFEAAHEAGDTWTHDRLTEFLTKPRDAMKGTKMSFAGLRKQEEIDAVIAYLSTFSQ